MKLEQEQALKAHLQAIAKILYDDSDPNAMQTLEGIEMTVRQKIQAHVSPELGGFYWSDYSNNSRATPNVEKHVGSVRNYHQTSRKAGSIAASSNQSSSRELLFTSECNGFL